MPKINILPKSVAELIAAGEVVERPSSVVKELLENSVDAGAENITVEIKNGGITYIRVTDDGCGIAAEDIPAVFISHATSKIKNGEDLNAIYTLGFRGEALACTAAVSKIELITKPAEQENGTSYFISGGEAGEQNECGCPDGTTIVVRDLFFNTPARMKFLKKDVTEGNYISDVVTKTALSHPEISFKLIRDSKQTIFTPGNGKLEDTVFSLFGKEFTDGMIAGDTEIGGITVSGFVSKPLCGRANRNMQFFFVNGRCVRIPFACSALDQAYKNKIMVGKFPSCVLFIGIPAQTIDVNVHPTKTEIRFSSDKPVFEAVYYAAVGALAKGDTTRSLNLNKRHDNIAERNTSLSGEQLDFVKKATWGDIQQNKPTGKILHSPPVVEIKKPTQATVQAAATEIKQAYEENVNTRVFRDDKSIYDTEKSSDDGGFSKMVSAALEAKKRTDEQVVHQEPQTTEKLPEVENPITEADNIKIIGEAFKTYIIAEAQTKLYIIDKHAAHERILFNKLKKQSGNEGSQMLLMPVDVHLNMKEYDAVINNLEALCVAGYTVEDFGDGCVIVRACPVELGTASPKEIITELAGELLKGNLSMLPEKTDWLYHSTACRAAVKAGDTITVQEQLELVRQVLTDSNVRYCPHGRPVLIELSDYELKKQFGRLG